MRKYIIAIAVLITHAIISWKVADFIADLMGVYPYSYELRMLIFVIFYSITLMIIMRLEKNYKTTKRK